MSKINTGPIDVDYPVPGTVNTTQGFRTNFSSIKQNLDITKTEVQELENKVLVKEPLSGVAFDNNMTGTLISNALISTFRHTTQNLGNNINGQMNINVSHADVQFAGISDSVYLQFSNWPGISSNQVAVQSNVQVIFNRVNAVTPLNIYLPPTVNQGMAGLENYNGNGIGGFVTMPANVDSLHFNFTTINGGSNIEIQPINRPRNPALPTVGAVTSVGVIANGAGFSVANSPVTTSGTISITNTGVTMVAAGANISVSAATGVVTITNTANISRIPLGIPNSLGSPGDIAGGVYTDNKYLYVCTANYDGFNPIWKRTASIAV
jgi:hypothetical protein